MTQELFDEIRQDHEEVKSVLSQIEESNSRSKNQKMFEKLESLLKPHMQAEEKFFYPALQSIQRCKEMALEALEEHHTAQNVMKELEKTSTSEDSWKAKLTVLQDLLLHHIEVEEEEIFSAAEENLSEDELESIYQDFHTEKMKVQKRMAA